MTTAPRATFGKTVALADDPQVFEFTPYEALNIVSVARWQTEMINGHLHRKLTGQFRYETEAARQLWKDLVKNGARRFEWAD